MTLARYVCRLVAAKEGNDVSHVLGGAYSFGGDLRLHGFRDFVGKGVGHVGADIAGGYLALTVTPLPASSRATDFVRPMMPALDAA